MVDKVISRRDALRTLTLGTAVSPAMKIIPIQAAALAHRLITQEKSAAPFGEYVPKFFTPHQYKTVQTLCQTIIPPDDNSGGAVEAGAPEFIDLLTSENKDYQLTLGGGLMWLDSTCSDRYGKTYRDCSAAEQKEILDLIAYRANAQKYPSLSHGIHFFSLLRRMTADGFYTSAIGIKDLQYIGNTFVGEFPGCPPVPEV